MAKCADCIEAAPLIVNNQEHPDLIFCEVKNKTFTKSQSSCENYDPLNI